MNEDSIPFSEAMSREEAPLEDQWSPPHVPFFAKTGMNTRQSQASETARNFLQTKEKKSITKSSRSREFTYGALLKDPVHKSTS
mmetsp:Transcript_57468/g.166918  ORF Transcript_57468/g.166918 Transcript_57468/m.166918 type:complete len:84 (-) Transcript_57468:641-892(-)